MTDRQFLDALYSRALHLLWEYEQPIAADMDKSRAPHVTRERIIELARLARQLDSLAKAALETTP